MSWWIKKAARLQESVRQSEILSDQRYNEDDVRRATVHAREDIVLLTSLLSSIIEQLIIIKYLLAFALALGFIAVVRLL